MIEDYLPLIGGIGVALVTAGAALCGVAISQWGARRLQEGQATAAAALDRDRRESEKALEEARRAHQVERELWQKRCEVYADFEAQIDAMQLHGLRARHSGGPTVNDVASTNALLAKAESTLYLVASKETAKVAVLLAHAVRGLGARSERGERDAKLRTIKQARHLFLKNAREDLGISGDFLDFGFPPSTGGDALEA